MGLTERIESLPPEMQVEVANFVEYLHKKRTEDEQVQEPDKSLAAIKRLKGLGQEIWQDIDPDQYVEDLRRDW